MLTFLEVFHHWMDRQIAVDIFRSAGDVGWECPPVEQDLDVKGIWTIKYYIQRLQDNIAAHIINRPIYELCMGAETMPGSRRFMRWWDQDVGWEVE